MNKFQAMLKKPVLLLMVLMFILLIYLNNRPAKTQLSLLSADSTQTTVLETNQEDSLDSDESRESTLKLIMVDIQGEVYQPGVYELPAGSRVIDLIELAGGLKPDAYERALNRALILEDQMSIYVQNIKDPDLSQVKESNNNMGSHLPSLETRSNQVININLADAKQLQDLKGIGPAKAEAIVAYREENGPFQTIEAIKEVPGIGQKTFENIETMIVVK